MWRRAGGGAAVDEGVNGDGASESGEESGVGDGEGWKRTSAASAGLPRSACVAFTASEFASEGRAVRDWGEEAVACRAHRGQSRVEEAIHAPRATGEEERSPAVASHCHCAPPPASRRRTCWPQAASSPPP